MSRRPALPLTLGLGLLVGSMTLSSLSAEPDPDATYKRIFNRMDADGDGVVTEQEYVDRSRWADKNKARAIWRASDANLDGKVTEAEYCENRRVTEKAKEVFAWLDANKDGRVSQPEIVDRANRLFVEMDRNGNGEVTIPEFLGTRWEWQMKIDWAKKPQSPDRTESSGDRRQQTENREEGEQSQEEKGKKRGRVRPMGKGVADGRVASPR